MALARVHTWSAGEILLASDLNAEFNSILTNANTLISPFTANVSGGGFQINNVIIGASTPLAGSFTALSSSVSFSATVGTFTGLLTVNNGVNVTAGGLQVSGAAITLTASAGTGTAGTNWLGGDGSGGLYMNAVTGKTINFGINNAAATLAISATLLTAAALGASTTWVAGDKYVVIDSSGNFHRSAIGPGS